MILDSSLKVCFVMLENLYIFVRLFKPQRWGNLPIYDRHFYALFSPYTAVSYPRVGALMRPLPLW